MLIHSPELCAALEFKKTRRKTMGEGLKPELHSSYPRIAPLPQWSRAPPIGEHPHPLLELRVCSRPAAASAAEPGHTPTSAPTIGCCTAQIAATTNVVRTSGVAGLHRLGAPVDWRRGAYKCFYCR